MLACVLREEERGDVRMMARHGCGFLFLSSLRFFFSCAFWLSLFRRPILYQSLAVSSSRMVVGIVVVSCVVHKQDSLPQIYKIEAATSTDKLFPTSNPTIKRSLVRGRVVGGGVAGWTTTHWGVSEQGSFGGCLRVRIGTSGKLDSIAEARLVRFTLPRIIRTLITCVSAPGPLHRRKNPRFELARDLNLTVSDPRNFIGAVLYEISKKTVAFATGDDIAACDKI